MPSPSPRRNADPRPYPGAPTRTRPHHARPGTTRSTRQRSARGEAAASIPGTVLAPTRPVETSLLWPPAAVRQITTAFSEHGARVGLLACPDIEPDQQAAAFDEHVDAAMSVIDKLGRAGVLDHLPPPTCASTASSQLLSHPLHTANATGGLDEPRTCTASGPIGDLDLVITRLTPSAADDSSSDRVALHAARRLRAGGILSVLTHSEQADGELIDPTGTVVAAGQNADLLYLQHLVVLHTPLHRSPFSPTTEPSGAGVHRRDHSDLLVFAQPTDPTGPFPGHEPLP